ncbi:GNAT family N-acetyltransferase [Streptomyces catenulae]|uniref:GNAT family N-acetyltransferase n=1 Tax=Streptomyces catenulae TaxID=66875 RepID=A0ABV2YWL8_9ACTN|nr:GNAT family N-acetyltransferase [Streptomyces catenulae]
MRALRGPEELSLFRRLPYALDDELAVDLAEGRRKPSWMWVALHGDRVLARVAWWSWPGDDVPALLDVFDLDDDAGAASGGSGATVAGPDPFDAGVRLLRAASSAVLPEGVHPEYLRFLPPGWRVDPAERRAVENRMAALGRSGARLFVERLRWEWTPQHGSAAPHAPERGPGPVGASAPPVFRPPRDRAELLGLMAAVLDGTLDAHSRAALGRMSAREAAVRQYEEELVRYRSPREWWRVAVLPGGEPVGFVIPARNDYHAIIAYLGVVPAHRGRGYADALLAEGTRVLAAQGVPRIRAATDLGNAPMSNAFRRAGYRNFGDRIDMTWD